jgi:serine/threonine-protein kinase RsbT
VRRDTARPSPSASGGTNLAAPVVCVIDSPAAATAARRQVARLARALRFGTLDAGIIDVTIAELASNVLRYAEGGQLSARPMTGPRGTGLQLECVDHGPGISDLELALQDGYSTGGGYGSGLPAVRRLMDELEIASGPWGTRVTTRKWPTVRSS